VGDLKELYNITKILSRKQFNKSVLVRNKNGQLITNEKEQIERWEEYLKELLEVDKKQNVEPLQERQEQQKSAHTEENRWNQLNINTDIPSKNEIKVALKQLKNNKAPGSDGILAEVLKADTEVTANLMLPLIQVI
jgi:hypothetical protein